VGPFVEIAINGRLGVIRVNDVLAYDGVMHAVGGIILPPRKRCHKGNKGGHQHKGEEEVEEEWVTGFAEDDEWTIENLERIFKE